LLDDVVLALTAMDHDGQVVLMGQGEMAVEPVLLPFERSALPVAVQPRFADGDHAGLGDEVHDTGPVLLAGFGRVVGVDPDGREHAGMGLSQFDHARAGGARRADGDDLRHAGAECPVQHTVEISAQPLVVQVGMGINQRRGMCGQSAHCEFHRGPAFSSTMENGIHSVLLVAVRFARSV